MVKLNLEVDIKNQNGKGTIKDQANQNREQRVSYTVSNIIWLTKNRQQNIDQHSDG